jgi:hypothetical protein
MEREYDQREALHAAHKGSRLGQLAADVATQTQYAPNLSGIMAGIQAGGLVNTPERDLRHIVNRISEACANAGICAERIHEIADRVKGSIPTNDAKPGLASGGLGDIAEIHSLLDTLFNNLSRTADGIGRLERL